MIFKKITISKHQAEKRVDRIIKNLFPQMPLSAIYKNIRTKKIKLNQKKVKENKKVKEGDFLEINIADEIQEKKRTINYEKILKSVFFKKHFRILFEDEDVLALDKPAGVAVHPGTKHYSGRTMIDLARAYLQQNEFLPTLVHRLDLETSGVLIFAKNNLALQKINEAIKNKETVKKYYVLVHGLAQKKKGTIRSKLARIEGKSAKIIISKKEDSKIAISHFVVLNHFNTSNTSLLEVTLETGRMHQIRVQMKSQGHSVVGDSKYGDFKLNREIEKKYAFKRMFLHSCFFQLKHPSKSQNLTIKSPLSLELKNLIKRFT